MVPDNEGGSLLGHSTHLCDTALLSLSWSIVVVLSGKLFFFSTAYVVVYFLCTFPVRVKLGGGLFSRPGVTWQGDRDVLGKTRGCVSLLVTELATLARIARGSTAVQSGTAVSCLCVNHPLVDNEWAE